MPSCVARGAELVPPVRVSHTVYVKSLYPIAGQDLVRQPGEAIEQELRAHWGDGWRLNMPAGVVLATAVLGGMAQVARTDLLEGCAVRTGRTPIDPWGDFSSGRWLSFLNDVEALPDPVPAIGRQSFWQWDAGDPHRGLALDDIVRSNIEDP